VHTVFLHEGLLLWLSCDRTAQARLAVSQGLRV
jgi:hypothetical protein